MEITRRAFLGAAAIAALFPTSLLARSRGVEASVPVEDASFTVTPLSMLGPDIKYMVIDGKRYPVFVSSMSYSEASLYGEIPTLDCNLCFVAMEDVGLEVKEPTRALASCVGPEGSKEITFESSIGELQTYLVRAVHTSFPEVAPPIDVAPPIEISVIGGVVSLPVREADADLYAEFSLELMPRN